MDRIDLLRVFVRVLETRNFTRAAADLGMSRSAVSMAVQELETRYGARMFHRSTRMVTPTEEGEALYARAQPILSDMEEVEGLFHDSGGAVEGRVRIEAPARVARLILAPALPALFDKHPGLRLEIGSSDRMVDLIADRVDLALRVGTLNDSGLVARRIGDMRFVNVASPDYLARHGTPKAVKDLVNHYEVGFLSPTSGKAMDWCWDDGRGGKVGPLPTRVTANNADTLVACAVAGMGIIRTPAYEVQDLIASGALVEILPGHGTPAMTVSLVWPHRRQMSRRVRVVSDWLAGLMSQALKLAPAGAPH